MYAVKHFTTRSGGSRRTAKPGAPALRRTLPRVLACVAVDLALPLVGCGESDEGSSSGVALEQLPSQLAPIYCSHMFDCCTESERSADFFGSYENQKDCTDAFTVLFALAVGETVDGENAGRLRYDPDAAADCLEQMRGASCADYKQLGESDSCSLGITPLVPEGGACDDNNQCMKGRCVGEDDDVDGTCETSRGEGATCDTDSDCDTGRCSYDSGAGLCTAKAGDGAPCDVASDCESGVCGDDVCIGGATECTL